MLIIYGCLQIGGIETFFIRLAKERHKSGLVTKFILLSCEDDSNHELINEIQKYSNVYFLNDISSTPISIARRFPLLSKLRKIAVEEIISNVSVIHVATGLHGIFAERIKRFGKKNIPVSVAFYHPQEFFWASSKLPYFEKINRNYVLNYLPRENLLVGPEATKKYYAKFHHLDFSKSQNFRFGVLNRGLVKLILDDKPQEKDCLSICTVSRLVEFKPYNLWMLGVINELKRSGLNVIYDVYGDGPLRSQMESLITKLDLVGRVRFMGEIPYASFDSTVSAYDLFIGTGTSIIQSAALGVSSIIAVDSVEEPITPGFFYEHCNVDYTLNNPGWNFQDASKLIMKYAMQSNEDKQQLSNLHRESVEDFYMDNCLKNFLMWESKMTNMEFFDTSYVLYELSRLVEHIKQKFLNIYSRKTSYQKRYINKLNFKKLNNLE